MCPCQRKRECKRDRDVTFNSYIIELWTYGVVELLTFTPSIFVENYCQIDSLELFAFTIYFLKNKTLLLNALRKDPTFL